LDRIITDDDDCIIKYFIGATLHCGFKF